MSRLLACAVAVGLVGAAAVLSGRSDRQPVDLQFTRGERNPVANLHALDTTSDFQFAVVSDRTGNHRANVFAQAVEKLNLLQPQFVVAVGDLIEGTKKHNELTAQWKDFDGHLSRLTMPFFYVAGNHDIGSKEATRFWQDKLGRLHYHFRYRDVLFLMLNADDPVGKNGSLGEEQIAYCRKAIDDNKDARWTLVFVHRPLWTGNIKANRWDELEKALAGKQYTVFCGHVHRYQKFVRHGQNYYQLATTGGGSKLRGVEQGEFDHIAWITMKKDGPVVANVMLDAIWADDLKLPQTNEPGTKVTKKPLVKVMGKAYFEGAPIPGAVVSLQPVKGGAKAEGIVAADGSFALSTYTADDGAVAGEYTITVQWRTRDAQRRLGPHRLPTRYLEAKNSGLRATIEFGKVNELILELKK